MPLSDADLLLKEDEEAQQAPQAPVIGGSVTQSSGPTAQTSAPKSAKGSGRFAALDEYLRVNQGQNFGQQVADKVGQAINKASDTLGSATNEFRSRADANTIRDDQGLTQQLSSSPENIDVDSFAAIRDAQYKGPATLNDTPDLANQVQGASGTAVGKANASKSESGRFALLDNYFGRSNYSQGQKALDNLLVQNDPNSQDAFKQMQENAKQLEGRTRQAGVDLGNYGIQAKATTEGTRNAAREAIGIDDAGNPIYGSGALGGLQKELDDFYTGRKGQQETDLDSIRTALQGRDISSLTQEQRAALGLDDIGAIYGLDLNNYLSNPELSKLGTTSAEQAARMRALARLAGMEDPYANVDESVFGTQDDEALYNFDRDRFSGAQSQRANEYNAAIGQATTNLQNSLKPLQDSLRVYQEAYAKMDPNGPGPRQPIYVVDGREMSVLDAMALRQGQINAATNQFNNVTKPAIAQQYGADQFLKK